MSPHNDLIELSPDIPADFEPRRFPIIAAHFYGLYQRTLALTAVRPLSHAD